MSYKAIIDHLQELANPKIAEHSLRFFKTGKNEYAHGDKFLGLRVPDIRQAVKIFNDTPLSTVERLLKSKYHEIRLFALLLLVSRFSKGKNNEQEKIYHLYLKNICYINNWDLVDSSAPKIIGAYLHNKNKSLLYDLSRSESLWERRIAIMSTLYFIKQDQFSDTLKIAKHLLNDPEDLIHKAAGWMLREVGNRDLNVEVSFLKSYYQAMPRTMLRYAIEKFSKKERQKYLNGSV